MRNPTRQKKWTPGITLYLFLASALLFLWGISNVSAAPRVPGPPWPSFGLLLRERFDQPYKYATNQVIDPAIWVEGWSGWALNRQGSVVAPWVVPMVVSNSFRVEPERGAIRVWYRPDSSSGSGSGSGRTATLLELITAKGKSEAVWWDLVVSPDGNEVALICQTERGAEKCLSAEVTWEAGSWNLLTLAFTPTNSALYINDQLSAVGEGLATVPYELASLTSLIVGSDAAGNNPASGQMEELNIFSGRKKFQRLMGNVFGLRVDWEIGHYYASQSKIAALGPISEVELAALAKRRAERKALKEAQALLEPEGDGGGMMLRMMGNSATCVTNTPLYITNTVALFDTNTGWTVTFDVQGTNHLGGNSPVEIFTTTNLLGNNITNANWQFLERGPSCATYQYSNQHAGQTFYILGDGLIDPDGDGLSTAYEKLVLNTDPNNPDTDGDGLRDGDEILQHTDPNHQDSDGDGFVDQSFQVFIHNPTFRN